MSGAPAEAVAVALFVAAMVFAVARPRGLTEAVVAVPAALLSVLIGIVPLDRLGDTVREIGPTVGFLAAILVFGHLCAEAGVFAHLAQLAARASRGDRSRLLGMVVTLAALVTATLTLDATVVLLTPVILATALRLNAPPRPHLFACTRLANSGSLLLPVSNLTNLLVFDASGLSFARFTALMTLPWLLVCGLEWLTLRTAFAAELTEPVDATGNSRAPAAPGAAPRYALAVFAVTVALFVVTSSLHVAPAWAALAGCLALLARRLRSGAISPLGLVRAASPGFCLFVLALAVLVDGVTRHGLGGVLDDLAPHGQSFAALLALAFLAALIANLLNNLPATLALVPVVAGHPAAVLALLLGVNIGPNATYPGSLATLLWRRQLPSGDRPSALQFHLLGILTVPVLLALAVAALWASTKVIGA